MPEAAPCTPSSGSGELTRFSVTAPEDLLAAFDEQIARRGDGANRSEAIRDLIRASLIRETTRTPEEQVIGSLTMIYDHHTGDLTRRLDEVQHDYTDEIVSTMHVHFDHHNCLEILALKGVGARVYELADKLLGLRGVKPWRIHLRSDHIQPGPLAPDETRAHTYHRHCPGSGHASVRLPRGNGARYFRMGAQRRRRRPHRGPCREEALEVFVRSLRDHAPAASQVDTIDVAFFDEAEEPDRRAERVRADARSGARIDASRGATARPEFANARVPHHRLPQ